MRRPPSLLAVVLVLAAAAASRAGTPVAVAPDGAVWVVNPDANTVARVDPTNAVRTGEFAVGRYPRTLAITATGVYVACQQDDTVVQLGFDGAPLRARALDFGCAPYGIATSPDGGRVYVACQGTSDLVVLDAALAPVTRLALPWPEARAIAVAPDGRLYVTHYITKEPNHDGHVTEVDPAGPSVARVLSLPADFETCETLAGGQGIANLLSAVAVPPAASPVAGQLWVGGTLHNSLRKGLFQRSRVFRDDAAAKALFPALDFQSNPAGEGELARRNLYKPELHDIARSAIWKIDLATGSTIARLDIAGGATVNGLAFSPSGTLAYAVDLMANGFYVFRSERGAPGNAAALFGPVSAFGRGGAAPGGACTGDARTALVAEDAHLLAPQARLVPTGGMEPLATADRLPIATGLEFTVGTGAMRPVPDGVGTTPIGIALSRDGAEAYVANYLARNLAIVRATPAFACLGAPATPCATRLHCPGGAECMPLVRAVVGTVTTEPLPADILDGKILFTTSARDAAGVGSPIPPFNRLPHDGSTSQGEAVSTARDGASLACASCHADFNGNDGRTWDFSQFGSSLRNTMDLRGRAAFAPGTCSHDDTIVCTTNAECRAGPPGARCVGDPSFTPPNIADARKPFFFNPMGTTHWNGDRDEVEDFEFTFRELLGASDCDGQEHSPETCVGALVVRRFVADPADVRVDLSPEPNRGRSARLDHLADYVYSLTAFPRNPNAGADGTTLSDAARRGRLLFSDPVVQCAFCHNSVSGARQQFSDKRPDRAGFDPSQTPRADLNSPYFRHDVGTANTFDVTNPFSIANDEAGLLGFTLFQNQQNQIPGNRGALNAYLTSVLNDVWNTAPYLHDGSAATLLDVVRPCVPRLDRCTTEPGHGRNVDDLHGATSFLSARQLNDLVAFQKAPHGPIVEARAVSGVELGVQRLKIRFGRRSGTDSLVLAGSANVPRTLPLDPAGAPVVFSIGVPAGELMDVVERAIPADAVRADAAHTSVRFTDPRGTRAGGLRKLLLKTKRGRLALRVTMARVDLARLKAPAPDYTIGVEVGGTTVAVTRRFRANRRGTVVKGP